MPRWTFPSPDLLGQFPVDISPADNSSAQCRKTTAQSTFVIDYYVTHQRRNWKRDWSRARHVSLKNFPIIPPIEYTVTKSVIYFPSGWYIFPLCSDLHDSLITPMIFYRWLLLSAESMCAQAQRQGTLPSISVQSLNMFHSTFKCGYRKG